jgi:hypothetical protein
LQADGETIFGFGNFPRLPAERPRTPVKFSQTVEDGSTNAKLGIRIERHTPIAIKLSNCIQKPEHASIEQIFNQDVARQVSMDLPGNAIDLRQMLRK